MKNDNSGQLKQIMRERNLKPADVAELIGCSKWTVYQWRSTAEMPDRQLKALKRELQLMDLQGAASV